MVYQVHFYMNFRINLKFGKKCVKKEEKLVDIETKMGVLFVIFVLLENNKDWKRVAVPNVFQ